MSFLNLEQINSYLKASGTTTDNNSGEVPPARTGNDEVIVFKPKNKTAQDEWDRAENSRTKPSNSQNPDGSSVEQGGGATGSNPTGAGTLPSATETEDPSQALPENGNGGLDKSKYEFDKNGNLITYPKEGESFKKTAERLGFKPGTPEYEEFVKANPLAGKRNWFKVGDKVKVPPSIQNKVNQAGIINKDEGMAEVDNYAANNPAPVRRARPATNSGGTSSPVANTPTGKTNYPKNVQDRLDALDKNGEKYTITKSKNGYYDIKITDSNYLRGNKIGEITIKYDPKGKLLSQTNKYNNGKIIETTWAGGKKVKTKANPAPQKYQDLAAQIKKKYGGNVRIEYNYILKKYEMVQTNIPNSDIKEKRIVVDDKAWQEKLSKTDAAKKGLSDAWDTFKLTSPSSWGKAKNAALRNRNSSIKLEDHFLSETTTYNNGKIIQGTYKEGKVKTQKTISAGKQNVTPTSGAGAANSAENVKGRERLHTSATINFKMPENAPENAKTFANSLIDNKEQLMRQLNIDNDTYNVLAQTAIGIAGRETNFGEKTTRQVGKDILRMPADSIAWVQNKLGMENSSSVSDWSQGITQLKFTMHIKDPAIKKDMDALGITNELQLQDPKTSAIATMVVLSHLNKRINTQKYQEGIKTAQGTEVKYDGWEMGKDGIAKKTGHTKPWRNEITRQDALCALWNGGEAKSLINGTFKPQGWEYTREVRKYTNQYVLKENTASRTAAEEKADATRPMTDPNKNNGDIGGVVFMPAMYTDKAKHMNNASEIKQLRDILTKKGIDPNLRNQLISALQNGELGFDFGLKKSEIEALTNADIKLILKHLDKVKKTVNANNSVNTSDGISASEAGILRSKYATSIGRAEDNFRKEYLNNHSKVYNASAGNSKVLREKSTNGGSANYVNGNGERRGFKHEKAKGVNPNTTGGRISAEANALANAAHNVVMQNPNNNNSGNCLTGVKQAMKAIGIDVSSMAKYGSTPKYVKNWFAAHPEMFTPVEYVSTGNGTARAINSSDLSSLPAGYIVIWEPEAGGDYASQAGHIAITNGNGQGYSDATDNLGWGSYNNSKTESGKGEHGRFVVYKLSDNWEIGPDGKIKLKG